jgi:hypothetical protein
MKPNILKLVDVGFHSSTQPTHFLILDFIKSSIPKEQLYFLKSYACGA